MTRLRRPKALRRRLTRFLIGALMAWPAGVTGQTAGDVTYRTTDGALVAQGRLIRSDGAFTRIQTAAGPITLAIGDLLCTGTGCGVGTPAVHIAGAQDMAQVLLPALIQSYARATGAQLDQTELTSETTRFSLERPAGRLDILLTAQPVADALQAQAKGVVDLVMVQGASAGIPVRRQRIIGLDALVPAVARSNPLTTLSMAQLQDVLAGNVQNWSELGYADGGPVEVIQTSPDLRPASLLPTAPTPTALAPDPDYSLGAQVAVRPGALALLPLSRLGRAKPLTLSGPCGRPVPATPQHLKAEDYPLAAPLMLILPDGRVRDSVFEVLTFFDGPSAQIVVRRAGYIDQLPERIPLPQQGQRLANALLAASGTGAAPLADVQDMARTLSGAERLTITFRFEGGGADLDAQSIGNLTRLAAMIDSGRVSGTTVLLVGFSDGTGPPDINKRLSAERAETVRAAIEGALRSLHPEIEPPALDVLAFGEALPIGCDETEWGRQMNRRVEVWLRP